MMYIYYVCGIGVKILGMWTEKSKILAPLGAESTTMHTLTQLDITLKLILPFGISSFIVYPNQTKPQIQTHL